MASSYFSSPSPVDGSRRGAGLRSDSGPADVPGGDSVTCSSTERVS